MLGNINNFNLIMLALPVIVLQLALMVFCLLRLRKDKVKYLPKWAWALIIIFGELLGPIVYLLIGRERD